MYAAFSALKPPLLSPVYFGATSASRKTLEGWQREATQLREITIPGLQARKSALEAELATLPAEDEDARQAKQKEISVVATHITRERGQLSQLASKIANATR